eukprot:scaffold3476_cov415-Prasinococcus_capsulatus_cf.AAC.2
MRQEACEPGQARASPSSSVKLFNSVMVVSPQGELVTVYDKSFLYSSDKTWAEEGTGFMTVKIPQRGSEQMLHCGLGICMDINPYGFQAPFTESMRTPPVPVDTVRYWIERLSPLLGQDTFFIAADRIGQEAFALLREGAEGLCTFCGGSCVIGLKDLKLFGMLDHTREAVLAVDLPIA